MGFDISRTISKSIPVTFRKVKFGFSEKNTSKYWHNNSPFVSFFWSAMSTAFPEGELFFMDTGRYFKDEINNPELKATVEEFIRQEAHHTYQHKRLNNMMVEHGFDMHKYENWFGMWLRGVRKVLPKKLQLSVSMALEHFTANFAHQYLANPKYTEGVDTEVKALWSWHAAEEVEHKGVLYDLYYEVGGGYFGRVVTLAPAWTMLIALTLLAQAEMLAKDGKLLNVGDNVKGLWYLVGPTGLVTAMLPEFFRYFKPGFHPWDVNDKELMDSWYRNNGEYITNLKVVA
ncbi:Predicted metal-dependent hydrolase [gamma proteobacterium HdN1]|nr:Predicted metal-dependent hydrolase [gamma proteobacterium HdN1]